MPNLKDLDMLLSVIENPTRRRILEALVREPHYPLQLSRELGMSQQAIMKHLKVLEEYSLVRSFPEQSDQGGPARKIYVPTTKFTIIVDFGPGLFDTTFVKLAMEAMQWPRLSARQDEGPVELPDIGEKVLGIRDRLMGIDNELDALQKKREKLIERKEDALEEAARVIEGNVEDYQTRRIIYEFVQSPSLSAQGIAEELGLRDRNVEEVIRKLKDQNDRKGGV
ncbi:MAG TPA: helix-turn-helix domain-containing protein [Methanomassiliicoccales archaeon]|nr:helix-turn-helix domain-containing protein [Methanomassiliicoccales archaeon]